MYIFNRLAHYPDDFLRNSRQPPVSLAREKYKRPSKVELIEAMDESVSFLIARHPFERLVSAYRDKIANALRVSYFTLETIQVISCSPL
jgi:chondroitin 4-sulfotransferase 11